MNKRSIHSLLPVILFGLMLNTLLFASENENTESDNNTIFECEDIEYPGADRVEVHYDGSELQLIGITKNDKQFLISSIQPKEELSGVLYGYDCHDDTIRITEKLGFRNTFVTQIFIWDGKKIIQIKTEDTDPSVESVELAINEALAGNLQAAFAELDGIGYALNYLNCDTIEDYLKQGHKYSLSIQKTKGYKMSATALENTFELIMAVYRYTQEAEPAEAEKPIPDRWIEVFQHCEIAVPEYINVINDYGFFLQMSERNEEAIKILQLVISTEPKRTVAYLNLADAFWSLGRHQAAQANYRQYQDQMVASNKTNKVPARVKERLK